MHSILEPEQSKWIKDNPSYPFYFVNCKIAIQKNNAFQLIDRVLALTKQYIYIYYYKQQDSNAQYQALNKAKSDPIPLQVLQCPQAKIQLKSAYSWSYFTQSDQTMLKYIQQILPAHVNNVSKELSLVLIKNNADFQVFSLFLDNEQLAEQLCFALNRTVIMKQCDKFVKDLDGQWNEKVISMLCEAMKGNLIFNPQDFGYGWRRSYDLNSQQKQLRFVTDSVKFIIKELPAQKELDMELKFKIVDDESCEYAYQFVSISECQKRVSQLRLGNCSLTQQNFESFMLKTSVLNKMQLKFQQLYHLDLSSNKLTDNIFDSLDRLLQKNMFPQLYRLNISKNYLTLSSNTTYALINFLSKVNYQLELNLSQNRIVDCHFIKKYLIDADRKSALPLEYLDLSKNKIKQQEKAKLLENYLNRKKQDAKFTLVLNLGELSNFKQPQIKYFNLLSSYYQEHEYLLDQAPSNFIMNQKTDQTSMIFTYQVTNLAQSNSRVSLISNPSGTNFNMSNNKLINQLFQSLTKLYVLSDYKQISLYRKQMQKNGITQKILTGSLSTQIKQKKQQQKRIVNQMQKIVNFNTSEKYIDRKLQQLVGLIRRRGIQGKGAQYFVYLKYKRDKFIEQFLLNRQQFQHNNPYFQLLQKKMKSCSRIFKSQMQQPDSFLQNDYANMVQESDKVLYQRFLKTKANNGVSSDINKFDQKNYNRLKYLLLPTQSLKNIQKIQLILQSILLQLKLPLVRFLRYAKQIQINSHDSPIKIKLKERLTQIKQIALKNKVQIISRFDITNYQFNYSVDKQKISGNPGILSRFSYNQDKEQDIIGFIQIVNNFVVFLYYTPQQISQQTLTYLVYIVNFLHNLPNDTKQDKQLKNLLIQELYLHIISYQSMTKLVRGILAGIFQYFTYRLYCSQSIQRYILAFLIKNQPIDIQNIKLNLRFGNIEENSLNLTKKIVRPDWFIPTPLLQSSLLNHLNVNLTVHYGPNQAINLHFSQNITIKEVWLQLSKRKFKNGNFEEVIFDKFGILKQQIHHFWIYQQKNINKAKYFQPLPSQSYVGQLVSLNKLQHIYLKRAVFADRFHNRKVFKYELKQIQLICLYQELRENLLQSLALISQSPYDLQPFQYESQTTKSYFLNILAQILYIELSIQQKSKLSQLFSPQYQQNFSKQEFQDLYNQQKDNILKTVIHNINEATKINFKNLTMDQKFRLSQLIKQKYKTQPISQPNKKSESISQKIGNLIQKIGGWGYTQTLIQGDQIFVINNRLFWIGSISHHTNQTGEIINSFTQLKQCIQLRSVINIQIKKSQKLSQIVFTYVKNQDKSSNLKFCCSQAKISGEQKFILNIYCILKAIAKDKIQWENRLLYNCQDIGIGNGNSKNVSMKYLQNSQSQEKIAQLNSQKIYNNGVYWIQDNFYDKNYTIRNKQNMPQVSKKQNNNLIQNRARRKTQQKKQVVVQQKSIQKQIQQNELQQQYRLIEQQIKQEQNSKQEKEKIKVEIDPNNAQIQQIINKALNEQRKNSLDENDNANDNVVTNRRRSSRKQPPRRRSSRQK